MSVIFLAPKLESSESFQLLSEPFAAATCRVLLVTEISAHKIPCPGAVLSAGVCWVSPPP